MYINIVIDSWGKIPSGIFMGNNYELGNYDECINTEHIMGQYCLANITLPNVKILYNNFINTKNNLLTISSNNNNNNMVERDIVLFPQIER